MIEYTWRITGLTPREIDGREGVAAQIFFDLIGRDSASGREQVLKASVTPPLDGLSDDGFVALDDLTPEIVIGWLEALPFAAAWKAQVADALAEADDAPEVLPWDRGV